MKKIFRTTLLSLSILGSTICTGISCANIVSCSCAGNDDSETKSKQALTKEIVVKNFAEGGRWYGKTALTAQDFDGYGSLELDSFNNLTNQIESIEMPDIPMIPSDKSMSWNMVGKIDVPSNNHYFANINNWFVFYHYETEFNKKLAYIPTICDRTKQCKMIIGDNCIPEQCNNVYFNFDFSNDNVYRNIIECEIQNINQPKLYIEFNNNFGSINLSSSTNVRIVAYKLVFAEYSFEKAPMQHLNIESSLAVIQNNTFANSLITIVDIKVQNMTIVNNSFTNCSLLKEINIETGILCLYNMLQSAKNIDTLNVNILTATIFTDAGFSCDIPNLYIKLFFLIPNEEDLKEVINKGTIIDIKTLFKNINSINFQLTTNISKSILEGTGITPEQLANVHFVTN